MTWYVYALRDPETDGIRYIGKSADPWQRLASHRSRAAATPVRRWVKGLERPPVLQILGSYESETLARTEEHRFIVERREAGDALLNRMSTDGRHGAEVKPRVQRFSGIARRLRDARIACGFEQTELSKICGLGQGVISNIERGRTPDPSSQTSVLLARALDVSVEWLVTGEERAPKASAA